MDRRCPVNSGCQIWQIQPRADGSELSTRLKLMKSNSCLSTPSVEEIKKWRMNRSDRNTHWEARALCKSANLILVQMFLLDLKQFLKSTSLC